MSEFLYKCEFNTPLGEMEIYASNQGIQYLLYADSHKNKYFRRRLDSEEIIIQDQENNHIKNAKEQLQAYFNSEIKSFDISLDLKGTPFQLKVWNSLLDITYGNTISYLTQAKNINNPKAVRAVANANGRNPIPIIIPCHRVIGSNGKLTGYAGGLKRKKYLLHLENSLPEFNF